MNYADQLAGRPFLNAMGTLAPQSPYARLLGNAFQAINTFRSQVPRPSGEDGMQPQKRRRGGLSVRSPYSFDFGFEGNESRQYTRPRAPQAQAVRSYFGG